MTDKPAQKLRKLPCVLHGIVMPVYQSIFKRNSPACYLKIVSAGGKKLVDIIPVINRHYLAPALIIGSVQRDRQCYAKLFLCKLIYPRHNATGRH